MDVVERYGLIMVLIIVLLFNNVIFQYMSAVIGGILAMFAGVFGVFIATFGGLVMLYYR